MNSETDSTEPATEPWLRQTKLKDILVREDFDSELVKKLLYAAWCYQQRIGNSASPRGALKRAKSSLAAREQKEYLISLQKRLDAVITELHIPGLVGEPDLSSSSTEIKKRNSSFRGCLSLLDESLILSAREMNIPLEGAPTSAAVAQELIHAVKNMRHLLSLALTRLEIEARTMAVPADERLRTPQRNAALLHELAFNVAISLQSSNNRLPSKRDIISVLKVLSRGVQIEDRGGYSAAGRQSGFESAAEKAVKRLRTT